MPSMMGFANRKAESAVRARRRVGMEGPGVLATVIARCLRRQDYLLARRACRKKGVLLCHRAEKCRIRLGLARPGKNSRSSFCQGSFEELDCQCFQGGKKERTETYFWVSGDVMCDPTRNSPAVVTGFLPVRQKVQTTQVYNEPQTTSLSVTTDPVIKAPKGSPQSALRKLVKQAIRRAFPANNFLLLLLISLSFSRPYGRRHHDPRYFPPRIDPQRVTSKSEIN
jgi:hypothetical protein